MGGAPGREAGRQKKADVEQANDREQGMPIHLTIKITSALGMFINTSRLLQEIHRPNGQCPLGSKRGIPEIKM